MLELRLRSGTVIAFDGRIVEVFAEHMPSLRFHIAQLTATDSVETADGARTLTLGAGMEALSFAREEAPACARLLAAIDEARAALARQDSR